MWYNVSEDINFHQCCCESQRSFKRK